MCHQQLGQVILDSLEQQGAELNSRGTYEYVDRRSDGPIIPFDPSGVMSVYGPVDHPWGTPHLHWEGQIFLPEHPETSDTSGYNYGDLGNCNCGVGEPGPCMPRRANISMRRPLLGDWIDPLR